jgi:hypothetical protein
MCALWRYAKDGVLLGTEPPAKPQARIAVLAHVAPLRGSAVRLVLCRVRLVRAGHGQSGPDPGTGDPMAGEIVEVRRRIGMLGAERRLADRERALVERTARIRGVWLDFEVGDLKPDEFPSLFPYVRMVIFNTFRHTTGKPRFRVFIPTIGKMSPEAYESLTQKVVALALVA